MIYKIFLVQETCARYNELANQVTQTAEYLDISNQYKVLIFGKIFICLFLFEIFQEVIDVAGKNSGFTEIDLMKLWKIADAVIIEV